MILLGIALPLCLFSVLLFLRARARRRFDQLEPWTCGRGELIKVRDATLFTRRNFRVRPIGIPTLFIHGLGASSYCWRKVLPLFGDRREWIAPDLAGFGLSSKDPHSTYDLDSQATRIVDLMDCLNIAQTHVVGSSLGGALGLWLHTQYPERFISWIGVSPALSPTVNPRTFPFQFGKWFGAPAPLIRASRLLANEYLVAISVKKFRGAVAPISFDERLRILGPYLDNGDSLVCLIKSLKLLTDWRLRAAWQATHGPLTLVWGQRDRLLPVSQIPSLVAGKQVELRILPKSAHHPMEDEPEAFIALLKEKIPALKMESHSDARAP